MTKLTDWLMGLPHVSEARPVHITIKGVAYEGADYTSIHTTPIGSQAYERGEREYSRRMMYVLGAPPFPPAHHKKSNKCAYVIEGEPNEWFIAGYWNGSAPPHNPDFKPEEYHPFGVNFMLAPWTTTPAIDAYERTRYKRVPLAIEYL